ncbi:MAG: L-serine ammonia-lyase [Kiritimatiellae bacterium]|nr:L-serine ammonia-lyase [Kiritimatiellia bacterium]
MNQDMNMPIALSLFDLFKVGPGPSSSHTIGPMRAGYDAIGEMAKLPASQIEQADQIEVHLYGSLSATGKGHDTDRAVLAGLMGVSPSDCPPDLLPGLLQQAGQVHNVRLGAKVFPMTQAQIVFDHCAAHFPYPCALTIRLTSGARVLFEREYYSVGGGFIQWKGWKAPARGEPVYRYSTALGVRSLLARENIRMHEMMIANEKAISGLGEQAICDHMDAIIAAMEASVARGIATEGPLPGSLKVQRKAASLVRRARHMPGTPENLMLRLAAYAFAASEENAAGHPIVTAPTCGSAGVIPSVLCIMKQHLHMPAETIYRGLLAAGLVGFLAKHNATLAGSEAGCQAEIGVAAAMAAAMLSYAHETDFRVTENAAEIALEHHLGMTCDPVGGYVQIPCIERNAMGAVKAYVAWLLASDETMRSHKVDLDKTILVMYETGKDLQSKYRETSEGGLAKYVY